ncbi:MAG: ATP-binding protein [Pseudomonadota bacterium]
MSDLDKTHADLVAELKSAHRKISELQSVLVDLRSEQRAFQEIGATGKALLEAFEGLLYVCSANYEVEYMNERFIRRTGYDAAGEKCYKALHDRNEVCPWCVNERVQQGETVRWEIRSPKDNRWYYIVNTPIRRQNGSISKMAMIQDITVRRQGEEALRESRERLELALEGAELGMWDWNIQTGELVLNERWAQMLGYTGSEIRPHIDSWYGMLHPEDVERVRDVMDRHLQDATPSYEVEYRSWTKSGEWKWILARGKVVERDEEGKPLRATGTRLDITDRKRAEELLLERTEALERSNRDLEQFAYVTAHDLREPLVAVGAYLKLLERSCGESLEQDGRKFLSRAVETVLRMDAVVQNLLAYARVGGEDYAMEVTDCGAVLENAISNLHSAIKESGAVVTGDPLPTLNADSAQLLQVFQNLLSNAIKFRGDRPLRIHVGAEQRDGEIEFSVKDNGIGIEPPYFQRIFRIFQRIREGSDRPGSGIGLANCRKIVERHGGRIWVESQPGVGSTFFFTLPTGSAGGRHGSSSPQ